jgi:hypothetical protein
MTAAPIKRKAPCRKAVEGYLDILEDLMLSFRDDYPEATVSLIYLGSDRLQIDGISILPAVEMLTSSIER